MKVVVEITCDNAAFSDQDGFWPGPELARIFREVADECENMCNEITVLTLWDSNGNRVGRLVVEES